MINFLAQAHMTKKDWRFSNDLPANRTMSQMVIEDMTDTSINVGFIDNDSTVEFDDMSSSLQVFVNDVEICHIDYPQVPIERTDLPYCFSFVFRPMPSDVIDINVSVTNAGETWSDSLNITIDPLPVVETPV
jgi:hypothetical protein